MARTKTGGCYELTLKLVGAVVYFLHFQGQAVTDSYTAKDIEEGNTCNCSRRYIVMYVQIFRHVSVH